MPLAFSRCNAFLLIDTLMGTQTFCAHYKAKRVIGSIVKSNHAQVAIALIDIRLGLGDGSSPPRFHRLNDIFSP